MLTIDVHAHLLPEDWPDIGRRFGVDCMPRLERSDGRTAIMRGNTFFREIQANCWDAEARVAEFTAQGVDAQVVSTVPVMFCYEAPAPAAAELARFLNEDLAAQRDRFPNRIAALGTLPLQDPELAIEELRFLREQLGLEGVQIGSHVAGRNLNDAALFAVFEAARDLDCPILVHPWDMMGRDTMPDYWLPWLVGMPAELSRAICSLIFGGVLERLPELRFLFAHGGGSFPFTIGRIEHGFNMRPDLVALDNPVNPRRYLDRIWVDSVTHDPQALRYLLEVLGADRVALGTDSPFPLGEQVPGSTVEALELDENERAAIFAGNALAWLGLPATRFEQGAGAS
jgi:aminocarboxymuconate-semialdehyde decarboxylase